MIIANKLSVESLVDKKTMIVQHSRRRTTAPAGKAHRDALVDFVSFVPPKMRQPGRNNMNLWCVLRMPGIFRFSISMENQVSTDNLATVGSI